MPVTFDAGRRTPAPATLDASRDLELVAAERHGDDRHAARERLVGGPHAAMRDCHGRSLEHGAVGHEALDARVGRNAERRRIARRHGGHDVHLLAGEPIERSLDEPAIVLELGRGRALCLGQPAGRLRRRIPFARPDHHHAGRPVAARKQAARRRPRADYD